MSKRRIHLQMMQMGAWMPKSRCGLWYSPRMTRDKSMVTCESCKKYFPLAEAIPMQQGKLCTIYHTTADNLTRFTTLIRDRTLEEAAVVLDEELEDKTESQEK